MANPVQIRGVIYPSQTEAANALGIHPTRITDALERGTIDRVGLGLRIAGPGRSCRPFLMNGRVWRSVSVAVRELGVSRTTIYRARINGKSVVEVAA